MFSLILPSPFFFFLPRYLSTGWVCDIRSRSKTAGIEQDDQNQPDRSGQPDTVLWILCLARIRLWRCQLLHQRGILPEDPLRDLCLMREGDSQKCGAMVNKYGNVAKTMRLVMKIPKTKNCFV